MKVKLEMELADVLRISVLLDHHRREAADSATNESEKTSAAYLWSGWGTEAAQLNEKLLKAVTVSKASS